MTTITARYHHSNSQRKSRDYRQMLGNRSGSRLHSAWANGNPAATILGIAGYFLLLGSIAVVAISEQFPWFMAAPLYLLMAVFYLRHANQRQARSAACHRRSNL